jgi:hypothetical protein
MQLLHLTGTALLGAIDSAAVMVLPVVLQMTIGTCLGSMVANERSSTTFFDDRE